MIFADENIFRRILVKGCIWMTYFLSMKKLQIFIFNKQPGFCFLLVDWFMFYCNIYNNNNNNNTLFKLVKSHQQCCLSTIVYNINMHPINYKYENYCQVLKDAWKQCA